MTTSDQQSDSSGSWAHGGARALTRLHEQHLRQFLATWRRAKAAGVDLPADGSPAYESLEMLMFHVLRAGKGYLVGLCGTLRVPCPELRDPPRPDPARGDDAGAPVVEGAEAYIEELLAAFRRPFREATEQEFYSRTGEAPWGAVYCADALFEHAVMHPIRHSLQLEDLLRG